jgi:hypothetical protein
MEYKADQQSKGVNPMIKQLRVLLAGSMCGLLLIASSVRGEGNAVDWKALQGAKITLEKGLDAAQQKGKPISAKFEVEDGKLQLSTYTAKGGKFSEVVVDHTSGKIAKSEVIKEGDDYKDATEQVQAMTKAKKSLRAAVAKAVAANPGYRAISAIPSLKEGKPVATIVLQNAGGTKNTVEKLD